MDNKPTREQLVSALRVLGHSEEECERIFRDTERAAKWMQDERPEIPTTEAVAYTKMAQLSDAFFPALWAHVNHSKPNT